MSQILLCLDTQCATLVPRTDGLEMMCFNSFMDTTRMSYEGDTCSFTCNTGYELTGSDTRTCQSDETWSGSEAMCNRGNRKTCTECVKIKNGNKQYGCGL